MKRNVERLQKLDNNLKVTERRLEMVPFMNTASANFEESSDERKKTAMHAPLGLKEGDREKNQGAPGTAEDAHGGHQDAAHRALLRGSV